jgi:hypothetical protein
LSKAQKTLFTNRISKENAELEETYTEVFSEIDRQCKIDKPFEIIWQGHRVQINFYKWELQEFTAQPTQKLNINIDEAIKFKHALARLSIGMCKPTASQHSKEIAALPHKITELAEKIKILDNHKSDKKKIKTKDGLAKKMREEQIKLKNTYPPSWTCLYKIKADDKKSPDRFDKANS